MFELSVVFRILIQENLVKELYQKVCLGYRVSEGAKTVRTVQEIQIMIQTTLTCGP